MREQATAPTVLTTATAVSVYDVSDRTAPTLSAKFKQDGSYLTSRILDGVLYLISNDAKDSEPVETKPETYVPCIEENGIEQPINAGCIYIVPEPDSTQYTVISAIRLSDCSLISNQSVLGGGTEFYISQNNLYFSRTIYDTEEGDAYTEDGYDVQEYKDSSHTELLRFSLQDGNIAPEAEGEVPGYLLNQFAMDEYEGDLRVVTTQDENTYRTYTDSKHGWVNYQADRDVQENALYVLDASLKTIGKIEGLAEDERVYSVRFAGETGYFCHLPGNRSPFLGRSAQSGRAENHGQAKNPGIFFLSGMSMETAFCSGWVWMPTRKPALQTV